MHTLITGASQGIGRALAEKFASQGSHLYLCARGSEALHALASELEQRYPAVRVHCFPCDVSSKHDVQLMADNIRALTPVLDVVINNAGLFLPGSILEEADDVLENLMQTNVMSAYHLTRRVISLVRASEKGHIFNMCSIASFMAYPSGGSYAITKFALLGFSKVLREELKDKGIRVTAVMPGATWTHSWEGSGFSPERMMPASDVAEAIWSAYALSAAAVVEEMILRPQLGDL